MFTNTRPRPVDDTDVTWLSTAIWNKTAFL